MSTNPYSPRCRCGRSLDMLDPLPGGTSYDAGSGYTESEDRFECACGMIWTADDIEAAEAEPPSPVVCLQQAQRAGDAAIASALGQGRPQSQGAAKLHATVAATWARRYREQVPERVARYSVEG